MKKKSFVFGIAITAMLFITLKAQVIKTANVITAGTLSTVAASYLSTVTNLTITGNIDTRDFKTMRDNMPLLTVLDISAVSIQTYTGVNGTSLSGNTIIYPVNEIPVNSFCNGSKILLTYVTIPNSVTSIGASAFQGCTGLTSVAIPTSITSIGFAAFQGCTGLTSVAIPVSITSIGASAFLGCTGLTSVTIPASVTSIGTSAFLSCSSMETVNYNAINCTSVYDSSTSPFRNLNGIKTINISTNVKTIPAYLFCGCTGLTSITIPTSVASIGDYAFQGCSSLETVNYNARKCTSFYSSYSPFANSSTITTINIGDSVKSLPNNLFSNCTRVREINSKAAFPPSIDATTFNNVSRNIPIYPPLASREDYIFDPYWSEFFRVYAKDFTNITIYLNKQMVSIMTVGNGYILKQPVKSGEAVSYLIQPDTNYKIATLTVNGINMIDSLDSNGYLNFKAIKENKTIVITPTNISAGNVISKANDNTIRTWSADGKLFVESNSEMEQVELFDINGRILETKQNNAFAYVLNQPSQTVNVVRVRLLNGDFKTVKVISN